MRSTAFLALAATFTFALRSATAGDFNGDGFDDLAVGVIGEAAGAVLGTGAVHVFPGSAGGPSGALSIVLDATSFGALSQTSQFFGNSIAWGDFDGDGFDDLAIGAKGTTVSGRYGAGRIYVVSGSASGFDFTKAKSFDQNTKGIKDKVEPEVKGAPDSWEGFGWALAVGDFDGNGYDDLAVGAIGERIGKHASAGAIHVLYGGSKGLTAKANQLWHQNSKSIKGACAAFDQFGGEMATGDLNGDGFDDLAVTAREPDGAITHAGRVAILFGSKKRLRAAKNLLLDFVSTPELGSELSSSALRLACGNFDGDPYDDLAIGSSQAPVALNGTSQGAVFILRGGPLGPVIGATVALTQGDGIVPGVSEDDEGFGSALAAADFDADGFDDLAVSAVGEAVAGASSGRVSLLYGTANGLGAADATTIDQDTPSVSGIAEPGDLFGRALNGTDFDGNGCADLAVGVPGEDIGAIASAGAVNVLFSLVGVGVTTAGDFILDQDQPGTADEAEASDAFGFVLAR